MSQQAIPTPLDCSSNCVPSGTSSTPGPQGPAGADGADGTDGVNAYSTATGGEAMPAEQESVTITVDETAWMVVGQILYVFGWGWMRVDAVPTGTTVTLINLEDTTTGVYEENADPGTVLTPSSKISPGGLQGVTGTLDGDLYLLKSANLSDVDDPGSSRQNLGLGTVAIFDWGVNNGQIPSIDDAGGIGNNQFVVGTGTGVEGLTVAEVQALLGISTATNPAMLLFTQNMGTGVDGGDFAAGSWVTVPLNLEVVDTGNNGSIAASVITLAAGTYRYEFGVVGVGVGYFQGRLWNSSAGPPAVIASSYSTVAKTTVDTSESSALGDVALGRGRFTIASSQNIILQAQSSDGNTGFGFGSAAGFGNAEVYSWLQLFKEV